MGGGGGGSVEDWGGTYYYWQRRRESRQTGRQTRGTDGRSERGVKGGGGFKGEGIYELPEDILMRKG